MLNKLKLSFATLLFISSAQAAPIVSYSPALSVGSLERFTVSNSGSDVTANYTIQSIAADPTSGYTPRKGATLFRAMQAGSFTITYVSNVDSSTFTDTAVMTAAPAYVQLSSGSGQNANTGTALPQPIKVQVLDSSSNSIFGISVIWSISGNGGTFSSSSITDASGIASTTLTMGATPGTFSVSAAVGSIVLGDSISATANPVGNQLTNLRVQTQPSSLAQQGISFPSQPVLALTNSSNSVYSTPTTVTASAFLNSSCTSPASGVLSGTLSIQSIAGTGLATFTNLNYSALNPIFIKFVAGSLSACSAQVNVVQPAASATKISLNFIPTSAYTAQQFNLLANVTDSSGNIIQSASNQISLAVFSDAACSVAPTGTLSGGSAISSYQGQALFNSLIYSKAETIYLQASATGLTSACSTGIQIKTNPVNIATKIVFYSQPSAELAGQVFSAQPFVVVQNTFGLIYQGSASVPVTITSYSNATCSTPTSGALSGGVNINTVFGVGAFNNLSSATSGTIYLGASSPGLTSSCSTAIVINPTATSSVTQLKYTVAPSTSALVSTFLLTQPTIEVDDSSGTLVSNAQGFISLAWYRDSTCSTPVAGLNEVYGRLVNGKASFSFIGLSSIGTYYLGASLNSIAPACSQAISIASSLSMTPKTSTVFKSSILQMSVIGGSSPYTFSATGGTVNSSGLFTAGSTLGAATVTVTDSGGSSVTSNLTIMISDGSLDLMFNSTGQVISDLGIISGGASSYIYPSTADVGPDGSVYLGSNYYTGSSSTMIVKYNAEGTLDSTFGSAGVLLIPGYGIIKLKTLLNGDLIICLESQYPGPYTAVLRRYTPTGILVSTFGVNGSASFNYAADTYLNNTSVQKIATDSYDNIYLAAYDYTGSSYEIRGIKFSSSGSLIYSKSLYSDPTYSADLMTLGLTSSNGKMIISFNAYTSPTSNYVYVINSAGSLDSNFNSGNYLNLQGLAPINYTTNGVRSNLDGSILAFGQDNNNPSNGIVIKLTASGLVDSTFGTNGVLSGNFGPATGSSMTPSGVQLINTTGNKILTTKGSAMGSIYGAYLLRTNMDGTVDTSFNGGTAIDQSAYLSNFLNYIDTLVGIDGKITSVAYYYDLTSNNYKTLISRYTSSVTNGPIFTDPINLVLTENQTHQFNIVGGTAPYTITMSSGPGTVTAGLYTPADITGDTTATLLVTDSKGATSTFSFGLKRYYIAYDATQPIFANGDELTITVTGTSPGQSVSVSTNSSGGSATLLNGIVTYTSGTTFGGTDSITITDTSGYAKTISVVVQEPEPVFKNIAMTGSLIGISHNSLTYDTTIYAETIDSSLNCRLYSIVDGSTVVSLLITYTGCTTSDSFGESVNPANGERFLYTQSSSIFNYFRVNSTATSAAIIDPTHSVGNTGYGLMFVGTQAFLQIYSNEAPYKINSDNTVTAIDSAASYIWYNGNTNTSIKAIGQGIGNLFNYVDNTGTYGAVTLASGFTASIYYGSSAIKTIGPYIFTKGRSTNGIDRTGIIKLDSSSANFNPVMMEATTIATASFTGDLNFVYFYSPLLNSQGDLTVPVVGYYSDEKVLYLINPTTNAVITRNVYSSDMTSNEQAVYNSSSIKNITPYSINGRYFLMAEYSSYDSTNQTRSMLKKIYQVTSSGFILIASKSSTNENYSGNTAINDISITSEADSKTGTTWAYLLNSDSSGSIAISKMNTRTGVFSPFLTTAFPYSSSIAETYSNGKELLTLSGQYDSATSSIPKKSYSIINNIPSLIYDSTIQNDLLSYSCGFANQNGEWLMSAQKSDYVSILIKDISNGPSIYTGTSAQMGMGGYAGLTVLDSRYTMTAYQESSMSKMGYIDYNNNNRVRTFQKVLPSLMFNSYTFILGFTKNYYILQNKAGVIGIYYY